MGLAGFKRMCPHTILIQARGPLNKHGEPTEAQWVTVATFRGRVVDKQELVRTEDQRMVESKRRVYVAGDYAMVPENHRLVLPAGFTPQKPPVQHVSRYPTKAGAHHMTVYL